MQLNMEADVKIIELEQEIITVLNKSGLPPTVLQLVLTKIENNLSTQINGLLIQYQQQQQVLQQEKEKQEQDKQKIELPELEQ